MIDIADGRPRRRYSNGATVALYPCARCGKNLVTKKGKMCRKCACRTREENYIAKGIKHPVNATFADPARTTKFVKRNHRKSNNGCVPHWMINEMNFGTCLKCDFGTLHCLDTRLRCPHDGIKDFAVIQERYAHRFNFLESCTKGGVKSGKLQGGKRGRPKTLVHTKKPGRLQKVW